MATRRDKDKREKRYASAQRRVVEHERGRVSSAYKIPDGMDLFKFTKEGKYKLEIVPYEIVTVGANKFAKDADGRPAEAGTLYFEKTYFAHRNIGGEQKDYACPSRNWGKPCPMCEAAAKMRNSPDFDKKAWGEAKDKERQLFLIYDRTTEESRAKGLQLFETGHYKSFGELLQTTIKAADAWDFFRTDEKGMTLQVLAEEDSFDGRKFYKASHIHLLPRDKPLPDAIVDAAPDLDSLLIETDYKTIHAAYYMTGGDEEMEEEEEVKPKSRIPKQEEEDDEEEEDEGDDEEEEEEPSHKSNGKAPGLKVGDKVTHKKHGECVVKSISMDKQTCRIEDEDEELHLNIPIADLKLAVADPDDDDEEEEDDAPVAKAKGKAAAQDDDDEDEEEDEDEDQEPDDEDLDEEEEESDEEEDEDMDDEDEEEDEDDDPPAAKKGKPAAKKPVKKPAGKR